MIRQRTAGELIGHSDVVLIGERAFSVFQTCLIGMPVLRGSINAVYTSEPVTTLQEPFPAKPERPVCACGDMSSYEVEGVYVCRPCFEDLRERAL